MANKAPKQHTLPKGITIKWVKRANMWCKTYMKDNKQVQEWTSDKPERNLNDQE